MKRALLIVLLALASSFAYADVPPKAKVCTACHGADFNTPVTPSTPRLAGQHEDYIVRALEDYKSGARKNPIMGGQAAALSKQDIRELAAYINGLHGSLKVIAEQRLAN